MNNKLFYSKVVILSLLIFIITSCINEELKDFDYKVLMKGDLKDLVIIDYGKNIYGIDTSTFEIKAHIVVEDMVFGGVAKLNNDGLVFTHHRRASNNAWGKSMYFVNNQCEVVKKIEICDSPMTPKVIGDKIYVGSSAIETGVNYKFQVYDAKNYTKLKDFEFKSMMDGWQFNAYDSTVYLPVHPDGINSKYEYSYIVNLNTTTLDTTSIRVKEDWTYDAAMAVCKDGNNLIVFSLVQFIVTKYELTSKQTIKTRQLLEYPQIKELKAWNISDPIVDDKYIYAFIRGGNNDTTGKALYCWVKLDKTDLSLVDFKKLDLFPGGVGSVFYCGRYFVIPLIMNVEGYQNNMFIDYKTGEVKGNVKMVAPFYR